MACHVLCHELNRLGYEVYVRTGVKDLSCQHPRPRGPRRTYTLVSRPFASDTPGVAHLYRRSRGLIVYERTGALMEAAMCGCLVVAIPSESFSQLLLFHLNGNLGLGWVAEVEQLHRAQRTLPRARLSGVRSVLSRALGRGSRSALQIFADRPLAEGLR